MAVHSKMSVDILSSACVKIFEFAEMRLNLFVFSCDSDSAAPILKLEASHIA